MNEVIRKEVVNLPDVDHIYLISNSDWVNGFHMVQKRELLR